jgi:hypothetical protein
LGEEALPRDQMKARIRDFLYAQLAQAQDHTSNQCENGYSCTYDLYHGRINYKDTKPYMSAFL